MKQHEEEKIWLKYNLKQQGEIINGEFNLVIPGWSDNGIICDCHIVLKKDHARHIYYKNNLSIGRIEIYKDKSNARHGIKIVFKYQK